MVEDAAKPVLFNIAVSDMSVPVALHSEQRGDQAVAVDERLPTLT
jgi:hypothetical protein